jgi:hypothetical protein
MGTHPLLGRREIKRDGAPSPLIEMHVYLYTIKV